MAKVLEMISHSFCPQVLQPILGRGYRWQVSDDLQDIKIAVTEGCV